MARVDVKPHAVLVYVRLKDSKDGRIKVVVFECVVGDVTYRKYLRRMVGVVKQDIGIDVSEENVEDWLEKHDYDGVYDELKEMYLSYLLQDAKWIVLASRRFTEPIEELSDVVRKSSTEVVRKSATLDEVIGELRTCIELHFYGFVNRWLNIVDLWEKYKKVLRRSDILWEEFGFTKEEMMRWRSALKLIVACDMIKNKNEGGM